ncbi:MAG: VOC family protein [Pseudomonadota bacterium]
MSKVTDFGLRADHIGLHVYNQAETIEWYKDIFGFDPGTGQDRFRGGMFPKMRMIHLGDFDLEVYEVKNPAAYVMVDYEYSIGVKHLGFAVRKFGEWVTYAKSKGVEFVYENYDADHSNVFVKDNTGVLIEVSNDPLADDPTVKVWGEFGIRAQHLALHVKNIEDTIEWYKAVFGFESLPVKECNYGKGGIAPKMQEIILGGFIIELYEVPTAEPFSYVDFEFSIGFKHLDIGIMDRAGWTKFIKDNDVPMVCVVSNANRNRPESPILPHYVLDNNNMLIEPSDERYYIELNSQK